MTSFPPHASPHATPDPRHSTAHPTPDSSPTPPDAPDETRRPPIHPVALLRNRSLARLIGVRVASQFGDGAFQGALVSAVLFNPTRESSAGAIAAAFAVLLLPYSVIGPFAGALLDRWSRRSVVIIATVLRGALVLFVAAVLALGAPSWALLISALAVTGAARFVGSGLSAALPHTVPPMTLIPANALAVTSGAIASALGAGYAIAGRAVIGETDGPIAIVTATVAVFYLVAVLWARGFAPTALGPDTSDSRVQTMRAVASGLTDALRHLIARPTVGAAISLVVLVRFCFGMATLVIVLLYQNYFTASVGPLLAGVSGLAEVLAAISIGLLAGAVCTPLLVRALGRLPTMVSMMVVAAVTVAICGPMFSLVAMMIAAPVIAFTYQCVKVCVDAIVQGEADDAHVGKVFALYDTGNNVSYVGAFAVGAIFVPADGRGTALILVMAAIYLASGLAYAVVARALPSPPAPPASHFTGGA